VASCVSTDPVISLYHHLQVKISAYEFGREQKHSVYLQRKRVGMENQNKANKEPKKKLSQNQHRSIEQREKWLETSFTTQTSWAPEGGANDSGIVRIKIPKLLQVATSHIKKGLWSLLSQRHPLMELP
jgi:hypothetical protein